MTGLLCALLIVQTPTASDFFPLVPGTKWTYSEASRGGEATYVDEVGAPADIAGSPATPIITKMSGRVVDTRYYRVQGDTVYWVAQGDKKVLVDPQPILKVGSGRVKWTYEGETFFVNEPAPLVMHSEAALKGRQKVLDVEREILEVKGNGTLGGDKGTQVKGSQVALYAKGIGLVELRSEQVMMNTKSKTLMRLTKFEPAKSD